MLEVNQASQTGGMENREPKMGVNNIYHDKLISSSGHPAKFLCKVRGSSLRYYGRARGGSLMTTNVTEICSMWSRSYAYI